ncbi:uncharacterized protein EI97DRAFT_457436 [Westerdykella ornata]|uniref:Rhodopsin domain-containing protein n=1 Tax=Westerdykella ornata TaxID=318751 RepID=A0A6A6JLM9_WESOR|nr:uncharacterized protein EI97DRAFT_457436 [Westerdykella ornata]KAF2277412.1 hypothetical protein EI97DRAFT_457436 [Westerdykella ornata]
MLNRYARWRRVRSISLLAPDDWLMMTVVPAFYTTLIVSLNAIATGGGSNLYPPEQFGTFSKEEIQERIRGSKIVILSEQAMLNLIWTLKSSMLFLYARLSASTTHLRYIRALSVYVYLGWLALQITFFTACRPFRGYWSMPPPDPQCATYQTYAIVQAVFNLSSDVAMLAIPVPMLWGLRMPVKQKVGLGVVFGMGLFVVRDLLLFSSFLFPSTSILLSLSLCLLSSSSLLPPNSYTLPPSTPPASSSWIQYTSPQATHAKRLPSYIKITAATLTKINNLSSLYSTVYMLWYVREASVAVYVANLPSIWPLLREHLRCLRTHLSSYPNGAMGRTATGLPGYGLQGSTHTQRGHQVGSSRLHRSLHRGSKVGTTSTALAVGDEGIDLGRSNFHRCDHNGRSRQWSGSRDGNDIYGREFRHLGLGAGRRSLDSDEKVLNEDGSADWATAKEGGHKLEVHVDRTIEVTRGSWEGGSEDGRLERFKWEVETRAPTVKVEGPEGEVCR